MYAVKLIAQFIVVIGPTTPVVLLPKLTAPPLGPDALPACADDDVVAVGQRRDAKVADVVIRGGADEAVSTADHAAHSQRAAAKRHGPRINGPDAIPVQSVDDVVAVGQRRDATAADGVGI